jgi:hypothetical protein
MAWPLAIDYSSAIQNPSSCFADPELRQGQAAMSEMLGLPLAYAGNFASVFKMLCPGEQAWAVKCFTRHVADLQARYALVSQHLERNRRRFAVEFHYLEEGIRVKGTWYPVVKMRWVEGYTLNEFLREHAGNPSLLLQLSELWLRLACEMREAQMAHGDLQHGNVLLVPGSKASAMVLRLIDYDGMWVPDLADRAPGELGHPNYQHPQRLRQGGYDAEIDRFSHLVIYTALRCLAGGGGGLWQRHDNAENLLFRETDFRTPRDSPLWPELLGLLDPVASTLAGHLLCASQGPLLRVPLLSDLLADGKAAPWSAAQRELLAALVPTGQPSRPAAQPRPAPAAALDWLADASRQLATPRRTRVTTAASAETLPEVIPVVQAIPVPPIPVMAERVGPASVSETVPLLDAVPAETLAVVPIGAPSVPETRVANALTVLSEVRPTDWPAPGPRPRPHRAPAPPNRFPVPDWLLAVGLPPDSPIVRYWPVSLGVVLSLPPLVLVVWLMWPGGKPRTGSPAVVSRLWPVQPVEVRGGRSVELELVVDRAGPDEVLHVHFDELPPGVEGPDVAVPAGSGPARLKARLSANQKVEGVTKTVIVSLLHGTEKVGEQPLTLTVQKFLCPELGKVPSIRLVQGQTMTLVLPVKSNGNTDDWVLEVEDLPPGVTFRPPERPVGPDAVGVELTVGPSASPVVVKLVQVVLRAGGLEAARAALVPLSIEADRSKPTIKLMLGPLVGNRIVVRAGGKTTVSVQIERKDHDGPVQLRVATRLPQGVTADPVDVPAGQNRAELEFRADRTAAATDDEQEPVVSVRAYVDDQMVGKEAAFLKVEPAAEVVRPGQPNNPPPARGTVPAAVEVKIVTADGLSLAGTFYPRGGVKPGPCVLMLHDAVISNMGRRRREWVQLARLLQKQGCDVLTFDFRGSGQNLTSTDRLDQKFLRFKANQMLTRNLRLQGVDRVLTMASLNNLFFPADYLPWLVQDIVAARLWLDLKHDAEEVNTSNLIVVGEGDGAALGAIWLATEARRYNRSTGMVPAMAPVSIYEARDLCGAVWVGVQPGGRLMDLTRGVRSQLEREKSWPAMLFVSRPAGRSPRSPVKVWRQAFRQTGKDLGGEKEIADQGLPLFGGLLSSAAASEAIQEFIEALLKKHELKPWRKRNVTASEYVWDLGPGRWSTAKAVAATVPSPAPLDHWGFRQLTVRLSNQ